MITVYANAYSIERATSYADLVIGGVLVPGARAPKLVSRDMVLRMKEGAGIVDVCVDQGGCVETIRPTSHSEPVYKVEGVLHYGVPNIPAAVPRTATHALANATLPWALEIADKGLAEAIRTNRGIARGHLVHAAVAEAFHLPSIPIEEVELPERPE